MGADQRGKQGQLEAERLTGTAGGVGYTREEKLRGNPRSRAQFKALLHKNFRLKTRGLLFWCTLVEIIVPVVFVAILSLPRVLLSPEVRAGVHLCT